MMFLTAEKIATYSSAIPTAVRQKIEPLAYVSSALLCFLSQVKTSANRYSISIVENCTVNPGGNRDNLSRLKEVTQIAHRFLKSCYTPNNHFLLSNSLLPVLC